VILNPAPLIVALLPIENRILTIEVFSNFSVSPSMLVSFDDLEAENDEVHPVTVARGISMLSMTANISSLSTQFASAFSRLLKIVRIFSRIINLPEIIKIKLESLCRRGTQKPFSSFVLVVTVPERIAAIADDSFLRF
jgi:hypothetical protein